MRPYLAVIKDSFRYALRSGALWVIVAAITLLLGALAPLSYNSVTTTKILEDDVKDWEAFIARIVEDGGKFAASPGKKVWSMLDSDLQQRMKTLQRPAGGDFDAIGNFVGTLRDFRVKLNEIVADQTFYDKDAWKRVDLGPEGRQFLREKLADLPIEERHRFNRLLIERAFPEFMQASAPTSILVTYAGFPMFADTPLPLRQQQLHRILGSIVGWLTDFFIGIVGIFAAILVTAPIIPRMFDPGQLHLLLSKPLHRSLMLTAQYLGACVYVLILVSYLVLGLWLLLGVRFGYWNSALLWMIPLQVFSFAIYYAVTCCSGVIYKSTLVSIVVSILFFAVCFSLGTSKHWLEDNVMERQRITKMTSAGEDTLMVNEMNFVHAWNANQRAWDGVFESEQQRQLRAVSFFLPAMPPMVGPLYNPKRREILALQRSIAPGLDTSLSVGKAADHWEYHEGIAPPMGTLAMFREADDATLLVANMGLFRLKSDPLKKSEPVKIFGFQVPIGSSGPFQDVSPEDGLLIASPAAAARNPQSGEVLLYTRGQLRVLKPTEQGKYAVAVEKTLEGEPRESVAVAIGAGQALLARSNGRLQILSTSTLEELSTFTPEGKNPPRFAAASPDGQHIAVVFHVGTLWIYDTKNDQWQRPRVAGQGDISAADWNSDNQLLVADDLTRVTFYSAGDWKRVRQLAPRYSFIERVYNYGIVPLYTLLPKPGEMNKTFQYLSSGQSTSASRGDSEDVSVSQKQLRPWAPIWSGLLFIAVVLGGTCLYFERQEY